MKYIKIIGEFIFLLIFYLFLKYKFDSLHRINIINSEIYMILLLFFSIYLRKLNFSILLVLIGSVLLPILAFLSQGIFNNFDDNYLKGVLDYYFSLLYPLSIISFIYLMIINYRGKGTIFHPND